MYGYIYITTNLVNGKKYIGQHKSEVFNPEYKGSGKLIKRAVNKYGKHNFEVKLLEKCNNKKELDDAEVKWILKLNCVSSDGYYNLASGGSNGSISLMQESARQPEVRKRASESAMRTRRAKYNGDAAPWFHNPEVVAKRTNTRKERYGDAAASLHTEESKIKAKQARINKYGFSNACMMTSEVRKEVSAKVSCILSFDSKEFLGYRELKRYISTIYNEDISLSSLRRLVLGVYVKKYEKYVGRITIIKQGSVMSNKLKYDGDIPVAED